MFFSQKRCSLFFNYFCSLKTNKNGNVYFHFSSFFDLSRPNFKNNSPDLVDNNLVTPLYDFDNPSYHAEEESEEDCDLLELARLLKQEEKVIQPLEGELRLLFQVP
jgi:hypothetical protein